MIAITTSSSIRVNPVDPRREFLLGKSGIRIVDGGWAIWTIGNFALGGKQPIAVGRVFLQAQGKRLKNRR
jgi:hypothetical protein